jgi:hypothetical protein
MLQEFEAGTDSQAHVHVCTLSTYIYSIHTIHTFHILVTYIQNLMNLQSHIFCKIK